MNTEKQKTCQERVQGNFESRMEDLRRLWAAEQEGNEDGLEDLGTLNKYGLCFDYVAPYTWKDQPEGYFRYQLSTGGPGDEFRIYAQFAREYHWPVYKIEYWLLDWFDGAPVHLHGDDYKFIEELFISYLVESGAADQVYATAMDGWPPPQDDEEDSDDEDQEDEEE